jgi:diguanylate cyclase
MWLLVLTGGINSILFPISFLLVMHATIYWRTKGAFLTSISISFGYIVIFIQERIVSEQQWFSFVMNLIFIWIVGLFGSLIVLRERKHFRQKEIFHELVVTDYLTGLNNHRHFQEHMRHLTDKEIPFVLIMGDIDHFKEINDGYGHLIGDDVLRSLGKLFTEIVTKYEGHAFRYGGEEFTFLIPVIPELDIVTFFDELYQRMNEKSFTCDKWTVTMSFGVATYMAGQTSNQILSVVDELLYEAKGNGKNCACFETGVCYQNKKKETMVAN